MRSRVNTHRDLHVYQNAMAAAMEIFVLTKRFPPEEKYSMVDQIRRSSRSVCANIAEAWRKRRYPAAFIAKLSDAEGETSETQVWLEFALNRHYVDTALQSKLNDTYDHIISQLIRMIDEAEKWILKS